MSNRKEHLLNNAVSVLVEVDCGEPPIISNSVMQWDYVSTVDSQVVYRCMSGYQNVGGGNISVCNASGEWDAASLICQGDDDICPHSRVLGYLPQVKVMM